MVLQACVWLLRARLGVVRDGTLSLGARVSAVVVVVGVTLLLLSPPPGGLTTAGATAVPAPATATATATADVVVAVAVVVVAFVVVAVVDDGGVSGWDVVVAAGWWLSSPVLPVPDRLCAVDFV